MENNPNIKANKLNVANNEKLNKLKYSLGTTSFSYNGDGLFYNNPQFVNQVGISQYFPSFADMKAKNLVQQQTTEKVKLNAGISEQNIIKNISDVYYDLQYKKQVNTLYENLVLTYETFYNKAKSRLEFGETNAIESMLLQAQLSEYKLHQKQSILEVENLESALQNLLNTDKNFTSDNNFEALSFQGKDVENSLFLDVAKQNIALETAKVKLLKSHYAPSFKLGYAAQNYFESGWLHGLEFGIDFNFFNTETRKKVLAQKVEIDIANLSYEAEQNAFNQRMKESENAVFMYQEGVEYYKNQVENINPELIRITQLNYDAGQVSYLELLTTLKLLATQNKSYLDQVLAYNKAINFYNFLSAK